MNEHKCAVIYTRVATGQGANAVIVATADRLAHDANQLLLLYDEWLRSGIEVHYVSVLTHRQ